MQSSLWRFRPSTVWIMSKKNHLNVLNNPEIKIKGKCDNKEEFFVLFIIKFEIYRTLPANK